MESVKLNRNAVGLGAVVVAAVIFLGACGNSGSTGEIIAANQSTSSTSAVTTQPTTTEAASTSEVTPSIEVAPPNWTGEPIVGDKLALSTSAGFELQITSLEDCAVGDSRMTFLDPDDLDRADSEGLVSVTFVETAVKPPPIAEAPPPLISAEAAIDAVTEFIRLLSVDEFDMAVRVAVNSDWVPADVVPELAAAVEQGLIDADVSYGETFRQWCAVARCTPPDTVMVGDLVVVSQAWPVTVTWPGGDTAEFLVWHLEGVNITGVPPRL